MQGTDLSATPMGASWRTPGLRCSARSRSYLRCADPPAAPLL